MRSTLYYFLSVSIFIVALSGCSLFGNEIQVEKRLALYFQAENLGDTLNSSQDSLVITDFKFSLDRFQVAGNDIELGSSPNVPTFLFTYDLNAIEDRLIIDVGLGISDNLAFNSFTMYMQPVPNNAGILDDDFYGDSSNYSMIIKGTYNLKNFDMRISPTLSKTFSYEAVSLNDKDETLLLFKKINLEEVFVNPDGSLLDPTDTANYSTIRDRVLTFLRLEAYALDRI